MSVLYAASGRTHDLDRVLAQSEKQLPDDLSPYYYASHALLERGTDLTHARLFLQKYAAQEPEGNAPTLASAQWQLALVLEKQGEVGSAVSHLQAALRLEPGLRAAEKDLDRLQAKR